MSGSHDAPERRVPPAGNGSLGAGPDAPVAVPSSVFVARRDPGAPPPAAVTALLEAGPFAGLADLDAFERRLRSLGAVVAVRLCHFADAWADFELTLPDAEAPLQRELRERLPDALVGISAKGLRVELGAGG